MWIGIGSTTILGTHTLEDGLCINQEPQLGALSLLLKIECDFNPPTLMNASMDECHVCMD
jgi:hypothetical protein